MEKEIPFDTDDILEKMNYLEKVNYLRNENVMDKAKSMIDYANRLFDDFRQMMNAKEDINSLFEPYFMKFLSMDITQIEQSEEPDVTERLSDVHSSEKNRKKKQRMSRLHLLELVLQKPEKWDMECRHL